MTSIILQLMIGAGVGKGILGRADCNICQNGQQIRVHIPSETGQLLSAGWFVSLERDKGCTCFFGGIGKGHHKRVSNLPLAEELRTIT